MTFVARARVVPHEDGSGAVSVWFWCAGCETHHAVKVPGWTFNGDTERPTFAPSVLVTYNGPDAGQDRGDGKTAPPARCHSFVTDGRIQYLTDSTHRLSGQTVDLDPIADSMGAEG